jgi:hypothetical protein
VTIFLGHSSKSEILTKQQQNLVHYCSKGYKELERRWVGFFVDNVPVVENWMLGMCDVADCINDVRDPETIRFSVSSSSCHLALTQFNTVAVFFQSTLALFNFQIMNLWLKDCTFASCQKTINVHWGVIVLNSTFISVISWIAF